VTVAFRRSVVAEMLAVGEIGSMKEIEKALAEVAQAKVNATTASGRSSRGLIFRHLRRSFRRTTQHPESA